MAGWAAQAVELAAIATGAALVILGILLIVLSLLISGARGVREGGAEAGGVVMIGPLPIVFGTSQRAAIAAMVLAIALTALALILFASGLAPLRAAT